MIKQFGHKGGILVYDCEWVPNVELGRRLYADKIEAIAKTRPDIVDDRLVCSVMWDKARGKESIQDNPRPYLKTSLCKLVSICAVQRQDVEGNIGLIFHKFSGDESDILASFFSLVASWRPQLWGFNSKRSDWPIIIQRGVATGKQRQAFCTRPDKPWEGLDYWQGSEGHVDMIEVLNPGWEGRNKPSLLEACIANDIPCKLGGISGESVVDIWLNRLADWDSITGYCLQDALSSYLLAMRIANFAGYADYTEERNRLIEALDKSDDQYTAQFLDAILASIDQEKES